MKKLLLLFPIFVACSQIDNSTELSQIEISDLKRLTYQKELIDLQYKQAVAPIMIEQNLIISQICEQRLHVPNAKLSECKVNVEKGVAIWEQPADKKGVK